MNKQVIALAFLSLISLSVSWEACGGSTFGCESGYFCCLTAYFYKCCPYGTYCSSDGNYCLYASPIEGAYGMGRTEAKEPIQSTGPSYVDIIMMVDGFLNAAKFYKNFPECTKAFTKLVSIAPQIGKLVTDIKAADGIKDIIPIVIEAFKELGPKVKELIDESEGVPAEIKTKVKEIIEVLKTEEYYIEAFNHALANVGEIINTITSAKTAFEEEKYAQFGRYLGTAVALIFNLQ
jgi:hypothetical protein